MKTAVIGSGGWGTALSLVLEKNGHDVVLWSHRAEQNERLVRERVNPRLPGVRLPDGLRFSDDLGCVGEAELAVIAVPSFAVRETAAKLAPLLSADAVLISAVKGIEKETYLRMSEIIRLETGRDTAVISGPSHAEEVAVGQPTGCVIADVNAERVELLQDVFMNDRLRIYTSDDVTGVELCGALKNVVALCAGICDGIGLGDNSKALLMTRGIAEIARLGTAFGASQETFMGLAGIGDLIVTCTSMHSRNRRAGILIGQGRTAKQAMDEVGAVVEGYYAAMAAYEMAMSAGVSMPIMESAYRILYEGSDPNEEIGMLMRRQKKNESIL
ncbi:MAG: NAD(P)-dependent glycerol-3-phosphate dehydrogenase [Oscillospiraceae bacterium]|nr:NAD(P)-dependent glycerol-3-phosphate dehydrogenase [Oscillospiraceae bacterium]